MIRERRVRGLLGTGAVLMALVAGASPAGATTDSSCAPIRSFEGAGFSDPTVIDNGFLPFAPGTQLTLEGQANRGGGATAHRVVFTVTDLIKVIAGVPTVVMWDRDISDGVLVEAELAFFAQDDEGNVWNLGEYPEEYENGQFVGAPSTWIHELADAQGGIHMLGQPGLGAPWYLQGSVPSIEFFDCAKVSKVGESVCVPVNCYGDVLMTSETSPLDPTGGKQLKYHAPGVGIVQIGAVADREGETLVLTKLKQLSASELADARAKALKLDKRGYRFSDVYAQTSPAERAP